MSDGVQEGNWARIRNCFDEWSFEDGYNLRKAIVFRNVSVYWDMGLINLAHVQLLAVEFKYDVIVQKVYEHMLLRVNGRCRDVFGRGESLGLCDYEYMFRNQPLVYNEEVVEGNVRAVLYDVERCVFRYRLVKKYPEMEGVIMDMVCV